MSCKSTMNARKERGGYYCIYIYGFISLGTPWILLVCVCCFGSLFFNQISAGTQIAGRTLPSSKDGRESFSSCLHNLLQIRSAQHFFSVYDSLWVHLSLNLTMTTLRWPRILSQICVVLGSEVLTLKKSVEIQPVNSSRFAACPEVIVVQFFNWCKCVLLVGSPSYTDLASWMHLILRSRSGEQWQKQGKETKPVIKCIAKVEPKVQNLWYFIGLILKKNSHHQFLKKHWHYKLWFHAFDDEKCFTSTK